MLFITNDVNTIYINSVNFDINSNIIRNINHHIFIGNIIKKRILIKNIFIIIKKTLLILFININVNRIYINNINVINHINIINKMLIILLL